MTSGDVMLTDYEAYSRHWMFDPDRDGPTGVKLSRDEFDNSRRTVHGFLKSLGSGVFFSNHTEHSEGIYPCFRTYIRFAKADAEGNVKNLLPWSIFDRLA